MPSPQRIQFTSLLHRCKTIKQFKQTHTQLLIRGLTHPPPSLRPTVSFAALNPCGDINYAFLLLLQHATTTPQAFLFNTLIRGFARACRPDSLSSSLLVFCRMIESNVAPNNFTFTFLFQGCANYGDFNLGCQLHGLVVKNSYAFDVFVKNSLIQFYSVCGVVGDARCVFDESEDVDVVSWNSMIGGHMRNGEILRGLDLFGKMPKKNDVSWNSVLGGLVKFGFLDGASRVFNEMPWKSLVSWVVMISAYSQNARPEEALALFREMQSLDIEPNSAILVSVLSSCSQLGALDYGNWIYSYIQKKSITIDSILIAALIDMYAKCGSIDLAIQVFYSYRERNVSGYTSAISGLAMNGRSTEAIQLFEQMKDEGILPDSISYVAILCACSHKGWVEKGFHYFNSMSEVHAITPELDHYACMVDLLGRSGRLAEAEKFISTMPMRPDRVIWGTLLSACRVHGNTEMGQRVGNLLIELDKENDGSYILLSNIYAETMKGGAAEEVRNMMKRRNIRRVPGYSLIEVDGVVHKFLAGDKSHEKSEEIYEAWEEIVEKIRKIGYHAETRVVTFDLQEEEKETIVGYHSEKLALALGLICSTPGSTIRIVKNIRICNDCHSTMKLVSEVFKRKISIRDRKVYHHFEGGRCSCLDYW